MTPNALNRLRVAALHLAGWTAIALIAASQTLLTYAATGGEVLVRPVLLLSFALWYSWATVSPLVLQASRRLPLTGPRWWQHLLTHAGINVVLALGAHALYRGLRHVIGLPPRTGFATSMIAALNTSLLVYWTLVAISHVLTISRQNRERERRAALLDSELAEARLEALRAQIQPHFLFNTLHAIAGHIRVDARAAEDMLGELGELLRTRLGGSTGHEVPLREEMQTVSRYLAIQKLRFGNQLRVECVIEAAAESGRVPVLLVQTLVENACEHGIAQRLSGGALRINASLHGSDLIVEVSDDGAMLDAHALGATHWGTGLRNTRARLEHLYGAGQSLVVAPLAGGGVCARVRIRQHQVES